MKTAIKLTDGKNGQPKFHHILDARRATQLDTPTFSLEPLESRVFLSASADLQGWDCYAPATAQLGQAITVQSEVRNAGSGSAGAFQEQWYLSKDNVGSTDDILLRQTNGAGSQNINGIAANSYGSYFTVSLQLPSVLPSGWSGNSFYVIQKTDAANQVIESNESNNFGQIGIGYDRAPISITMPATITIPKAPSSLTGSATSATQVKLSWVDNSNNEAGFEIFRWNGSTWAQIATVGTNVRTYSDSGRSPSTTYYYEVAAYDSAGSAWAASYATVTTPATTITAPNAPSGLTGSAASSTQVNLSWADNSSNETGFEIFRWNGSTWAQIATVGTNVRTYIDSGRSPSTTYYYEVAAYDSAGSAWAASYATVTTPATTITAPNAPSGLTGSAASSTQVNLSWADNSSNETGFEIFRWNGSTWAQIATVGTNVRTYSDSGRSPSTTYYYAVASYNNAGSAWTTSCAIVTTPAAATGLATDANIQMLAKIITSEADGCNATEKLGVGSCVINRMTQHGWTNVSNVLGPNGNQFAYSKAPTSDAVALARGLLSGTIKPIAGITNFYSPISMPREGASTAGFDVGGGLEQVAGLTYRTYRPGWATTMQYIPLANVREKYFKFFK